ncbi:MAG: hypothetical protein G01um101418_821 [Parcubacteria group bacterium Gr01-1014_18]|nr:MAG: hypothetical protein Greene041636_799 [Parcubacteria group bacterium Greene0416_36]TSC80018.1 MAG: hypothetical protein G01um101418_821 [Parcubacteria group bacterium Gr01-1014_18]TSC98114.1 MAG: hypothetical protein Greene101420_885 [Parcubacteria group bacterium Greene1014_20]TSD06630.1 MAG: hypothetical protein Greene07142_769 [Parcubacteria group bacterium Greene0714_2]
MRSRIVLLIVFSVICSLSIFAQDSSKEEKTAVKKFCESVVNDLIPETNKVDDGSIMGLAFDGTRIFFWVVSRDVEAIKLQVGEKLYKAEKYTNKKSSHPCFRLILPKGLVEDGKSYDYFLYDNKDRFVKSTYEYSAKRFWGLTLNKNSLTLGSQRDNNNPETLESNNTGNSKKSAKSAQEIIDEELAAEMNKEEKEESVEKEDPEKTLLDQISVTIRGLEELIGKNTPADVKKKKVLLGILEKRRKAYLELFGEKK